MRRAERSPACRAELAKADRRCPFEVPVEQRIRECHEDDKHRSEDYALMDAGRENEYRLATQDEYAAKD